MSVTTHIKEHAALNYPNPEDIASKTPLTEEDQYKKDIEFIAARSGNPMNAGAVRDGVTDDSAIIQGVMDLNKPVNFPENSFAVGSSLQLRGDQRLSGAGKSSKGTRILTLNDVPVFVSDVSPLSKIGIMDFYIRCDTLTSATTAIELKQIFLSDISNVWIKNSVNGLLIEDSNSITLDKVMIMETSNGLALNIGNGVNGTSNIVVNGSNFEANPGEFTEIRIDGGTGTADCSFHGVQIERAIFNVTSGKVAWFGGKVSSTSKLYFSPRSYDCSMKGVAFTASCKVLDVGYNTRIEDAFCENMETPIHQYPVPVPATPELYEYGLAGEEWLLLATAKAPTNSAVVDASIDILDGAIPIITSDLFSFDAKGSSVGVEQQPTYTLAAGVKSVTNPISVGANLSRIASVRGGKNIFTNGLELDQPEWLASSVTSVVGSSGNWVVTPSATNWSLRQEFGGRLTVGKKYICLAKFAGDGNAELVLGLAHNGINTARSLFSRGEPGVYADGDNISMLSFEYTKQQERISIGALSSSTPVTIKWIMLIEA